jgi:hypothetical protein
MERRLNAAFIKIFASYDVLTSEMPLQSGDPCGLANEAALHSAAFAVSPFRLTRRAIKLGFRAQESYPDNHPGIAAG